MKMQEARQCEYTDAGWSMDLSIAAKQQKRHRQNEGTGTDQRLLDVSITMTWIIPERL